MALILLYLLIRILLQNSKNACSMYLHVPPGTQEHYYRDQKNASLHTSEYNTYCSYCHNTIEMMYVNMDENSE